MDVSFLVPTKTGLKKSIMDATEQVRYHLREVRIHDYYTQSISRAKIQIFGKILKKGDRRYWGFLRGTFEIAGWASNNLDYYNQITNL